MDDDGRTPLSAASFQLSGICALPVPERQVIEPRRRWN